MRNWRPLTWVIVIINLALAWLVVSAFDNCDGLAGTELDGCTAGSGFAVVAILFVGALVDVILGVVWMVTNRR